MSAEVLRTLENAIANAGKSDPRTDVEDDAFLSSWIVVAEWVDADGFRTLTRHFSEGQTEWEREGILSHALDEDLWLEEDD